MKRKTKSNQSTALNDQPKKVCTSSTDSPKTEPNDIESMYSLPYIIENFSKIQKKVGERLVSPPFSMDNYEFQIELFPDGYTTKDKDFIAVFLKLCAPSKALVKFTFSILDLNGTKLFKRTHPPLINSYNYNAKPIQSISHGTSKFVTTSFVQTNVLPLTDDKLIILCEIYDIDASESLYEIQKLRFYKEYLNNEWLSDLKIIVNDKIIYSHKIILLSGNEYFASMIKNSMKPNEEHCINVEDTEYQVLMELIRFIYTGQVHCIEKMAKKLMIAAHKYGVIQLKLKCESYLCHLLTVGDTLQYLKLADEYNLCQLKKEAISFYVTHRKEVMKSDNFRNEIGSLNSNLIADLMTAFNSL